MNKNNINHQQTVPFQEVELRALLRNEQRNILVEKLDKEGDRETEDLIDLYFCTKEATSFKDVEMNKVGSYSLRLRSVRNEDNNLRINLNVKVITIEGDHNAWSEHEVVLSSLEEGKRILEAIGFKPYFTVKKNRNSYHIENSIGKMIVIIEDIANFGPIIEVEIITDRENVNKAKKYLHNYLLQLGIEEDQIVRKSVTNILMNKLAFLG